MEYNVKKREFKKEDIDYAEIFFDNGDWFPISKTEIVDISIRLYDRLILGKDYWNSFCAVAEGGFLKLKLQKKVKGVYESQNIYNQKEYNKDRIGFIKNRLCNEGGVDCIKLYNDYNRHFTLYCKVETKLIDDYTILNFMPQNKNAGYKNTTHYILLPEIGKSAITQLQLDFENCESVNIDPNEIVDMQIKLNKELLCSGDYVRQIESGFIKIKLDAESNIWRENNLSDGISTGRKGNKQIINRLCGKKGFDLHDVCHLYIDYGYAGVGCYKRECVEINDIRSEEELLKLEEIAEKEGRESSPYFLGGYAEKISQDTFLITFGKTALKDERCQQELKKYSVLNIENE